MIERNVVTLALESAIQINRDGNSDTVLADAAKFLEWFNCQVIEQKKRDPLKRGENVELK